MYPILYPLINRLEFFSQFTRTTKDEKLKADQAEGVKREA